MRLYKKGCYEGSLHWSNVFLNSVKGIELYICLFGNASKMLGEVKFVIKSDSQYFFFFAVFNSNVAREARSVWSSALMLNSIKEDLSGFRTIKIKKKTVS